jgi:hypothetical protein
MVQVVEHLPNMRHEFKTHECQNKQAKNLNREFSHNKKSEMKKMSKRTDKFKSIKTYGGKEHNTREISTMHTMIKGLLHRVKLKKWGNNQNVFIRR